MNKVDIINRLKEQGSITQQEVEILLSNDNRLKHFWKDWKHNEAILLDSELVENLKKS